MFYLIGYLKVHGVALFLLYSIILTPWLQFILNISCKRKHGQRIYNNWYSSSLNFKVEQHLSVVHSPRMCFPLITNLSPVIFCASLRLADTFCAKIAFTNYIPSEDDYNYHCLFFYAIVKVMFSSRSEEFYFILKFCTDDHKWMILLLANLNAVLYGLSTLSF